MINQNIITFIPADGLGSKIDYSSFVNIDNPISIIHGYRINDISDAQVTLTADQYKKSKCKPFDYFTINLVDQVFIITNISTEDAGDFINYTIRGTEIFTYVLSNHNATIDIVADTLQLQSNFLKTQINNFTPDIAKSNSRNVLIHFTVIDNFGGAVNCIWDEGSTLIDYMQKEVKANQNLCFGFASRIKNTTDTFTQALDCTLTIFEATQEALSDNVNWELGINDLVENYYDSPDFQMYGPGGQKYLDGGNIKSYKLSLPHSVPVTTFYTNEFVSPKRYLPAVKNVKSGLSLNAISYDNLYNLLCQFTQPYTTGQTSLYTSKTTLQGSWESGTKKFVRQKIMAYPGAYKTIKVDGVAEMHTGIRLFYTSDWLHTHLSLYYYNLQDQSDNPYIVVDEGYKLTSKTDARFGVEGLAYGSMFITRKLNLYTSNPQADPDKYYITLHDSSITKDGMTATDTTDNATLEAYDVTKNINYFSFPIWSVFEFLLINQQASVVKLSATTDDKLDVRKIGTIIKINNINGEDVKGKINGITTTREDGTITRDCEIEWLLQ